MRFVGAPQAPAIRVETMLHQVRRDASGTLRSVMPPRGEGRPAVNMPTGVGQPLLATTSGFLLSVDADELLDVPWIPVDLPLVEQLRGRLRGD